MLPTWRNRLADAANHLHVPHCCRMRLTGECCWLVMWLSGEYRRRMVFLTRDRVRAWQVKWFAWELTALFRKLVFALAMVFVSSNGYIQLLVVGTYSCVHLGFTYYCMPHTSRIHNIVDMFLQAQLILVILFALTNIVDQTGESPSTQPHPFFLHKHLPTPTRSTPTVNPPLHPSPPPPNTTNTTRPLSQTTPHLALKEPHAPFQKRHLAPTPPPSNTTYPWLPGTVKCERGRLTAGGGIANRAEDHHDQVRT